MQINYLGSDQFVLKTKEATINLQAEKIDIDGLKILGPGEYERKGIFVEGISPNGNGPIFVIRVEGMSICYLGKLKHSISDEAAKEIGDIDIIFLPLGEDGTIDEKMAQKVLSQIYPRVVIPMLFSQIESFKKSEGITGEEQDFLKIKKIDLPEEERKFIILKAK